MGLRLRSVLRKTTWTNDVRLYLQFFKYISGYEKYLELFSNNWLKTDLVFTWTLLAFVDSLKEFCVVSFVELIWEIEVALDVVVVVALTVTVSSSNQRLELKMKPNMTTAIMAMGIPLRPRDLKSTQIRVKSIAVVANVRPSKNFLRPLCQILNAQLTYLWHTYVRKIPKIDINYVIL